MRAKVKHECVVDVCTQSTGRICVFINLYVGLFSLVNLLFMSSKMHVRCGLRERFCRKLPVMILIMHWQYLPLIFANTSNPVCHCALNFRFEWRRLVPISHSAEWNMCSMWCNLCCQSDASLTFIYDDVSTCYKQIGCQIWIFVDG